MSDWKNLVDLDRLCAWMDDQELRGSMIEEAEQLPGGTQNVLLLFNRGGRRYLLRRSPQSPYLDGDQTMRREARLLSALSGSDVPHARLIAECESKDVIGSAFYLMEPIDGFCATSGLPPLHGSDAALRHSMGFSVIDSLATLHAVDYRSVGLHDFGKPDGFLARQVSRWLKQLDSYARYPAWNGRSDIPGIDEVAGWLSTHVPRIQDPTIIHGDFHLGNILFSRTGPDVRAIVDWELATIGDPLVDLGCLLATWADSNGRHPGCISVEPWSGFPEETELVGRYAQRTGRDVTEINWYVVLACFKLGILQEGTYARAAAGQVDRTVADWLHSTSIKLFERALDRIKGNRNGLGF